MLQSQWHIIRNPGRLHSMQDLHDVMQTCIILHNMIIEENACDEEEEEEQPDRHMSNKEKKTRKEQKQLRKEQRKKDKQQNKKKQDELLLNRVTDTFPDFTEPNRLFDQHYASITNTGTFLNLRNDLIRHLWKKKSEEN